MPDAAARTTLTVYRRSSCHLCDDAEVMLRDELAIRARSGLPRVTVIHVDVAGDSALEDRYGRQVPVFAVGAHEIHLVSSARQIRNFLARTLPALM